MKINPANTPSCPVCESSAVSEFLEVNNKTYCRCHHCQVRFLHPDHRLPRREEYQHYLHHQNNPSDPGYRKFLAQLSNPLLDRLDSGSAGLDYGCGPGPALAIMMREAGHQMEIYDPFFYPNVAPLSKTYDFITCTETAEHFHHPAREFRSLIKLLKPGGYLGIMTSFQTDDSLFATWHYRRDPTHVVFYRPETFSLLARQNNLDCEIPAKNIVILRTKFL